MTEFNRYLFTISAGRTGTAWLADFLGANLGVPAIHEPLGIDDFGTNMPDIRTMRSFNDRGMDAVVTSFWDKKLATIGRLASYVETNHALAKCGLIESLAASPYADRSTIVVLTRDRLKQCVSYMVRGDFTNATVEWQWYLSSTYRNLILNPRHFYKMAEYGPAIWYAFEMEARQVYYRKVYGDKLRFVDAHLETIAKPPGAKAFLAELGIDRAPILPPKANANLVEPSEKLKKNVARLLSEIRIDTKGLVDAYLASGRRLDRPGP